MRQTYRPVVADKVELDIACFGIAVIGSPDWSSLLSTSAMLSGDKCEVR